MTRIFSIVIHYVDLVHNFFYKDFPANGILLESSLQKIVMDNHLDCSMNDDAIYKDIEEKKRRRSGDGPRRSFGRVPTSRSRANNMNDGRKPSGSFLDEISLRA